MSTVPRPSLEIQTEYTNACLKAGTLQYEILCKDNDLKVVNDRLRDLNFEYVASKNLEAEVAKKVAEDKAAVGTSNAPAQETESKKE